MGQRAKGDIGRCRIAPHSGLSDAERQPRAAQEKIHAMIRRVGGLPDAGVGTPQYETRVERGLRCPTRDGVALATDLIRPIGDGPFPAILIRTIYDKVPYTVR